MKVGIATWPAGPRAGPFLPLPSSPLITLHTGLVDLPVVFLMATHTHITNAHPRHTHVPNCTNIPPSYTRTSYHTNTHPSIPHTHTPTYTPRRPHVHTHTCTSHTTHTYIPTSYKHTPHTGTPHRRKAGKQFLSTLLGSVTGIYELN